MPSWIRRNSLAVILLISIALSFGFSVRDAHRLDRARHQQLVTDCIRSSERTALISAFQIEAAVYPPNRDTAERYRAEGVGLIDTIPTPPGYQSSKDITDVEFLRRNGRVRAHLTPRARRLQVEGCKRFFD